MLKTLILYESKFGFTEKVARDLSLVLGPAFCSRASQFTGNWEQYDYLVICTPVYASRIDGDVLKAVLANAEQIQRKKVVLICTCSREEEADRYLKPLQDRLGDSVVLSSAIGSESECDHDSNLEKLIALAMKIKELKDQSYIAVSKDETIKKSIDDFLQRHNTCALATGHDGIVRATPIEYTYRNGLIYLLSEGGEKFAHILLNRWISLCIYDEFKGMNQLGGIQITGIAERIDIGCDEYCTVLREKGLDVNKIITMPISLHMIKITITKIEFLWSEFSRLGYEIKQIVYR